MNDIGIYFGTFAPCHVGHFEQMIRAKRENKHAIVIVSGYKGDRGEMFDMTLQNRVKSMRKLIANDSNISVLMLDETDMPRYPHGWTIWLNRLQTLVEEEVHRLQLPHQSTSFYVGETEYIDPLQEYFNEVWSDKTNDIIKVDRKILGISGTNIREHPLLNWDFVMRPFRRYFVKNVLVLSIDELTRDSLVKDLAKRYSTSYSTEFLKDYFIQEHCTHEELDVKDYHTIGMRQFDRNKMHIHSPATRKVFFANSDVLWVKVLMNIYHYSNELKQLNHVFDYFISIQNWSLIFVIPPKDKNDMYIHEAVLKELEHHGLMEYTYILDGHPFTHEYEKARQLIDELLNEGNDYII